MNQKKELAQHLEHLQNETHPLLLDFGSITSNQRELVGGKGLNLGLLSQLGLPVPPGLVITARAFEEYKDTRKVTKELIENVIISKKILGGSIALRSSANLEDSSSLSLAGVFQTHYLSESDGPVEIEKALISIYQQAISDEVTEYLQIHGINIEDLKMAICIQELIKPDFSGVIYASPDKKLPILVQYAKGFGDKIVDGDVLGTTIIIDQLSGRIHNSHRFSHNPLTSQSIKNIHAIATKVSSLFPTTQDIEFALTGDQIFLLQSRELTSPLFIPELKETKEDVIENIKTRFKNLIEADQKTYNLPHQIYEAGNFYELLPHAKEMDFGIFSYIFTGSEQLPGGIQIGRSRMGYTMASNTRGFNYFIGGRPYVSENAAISNYYIGFPIESDYYPTLGVEYTHKLFRKAADDTYGDMDIYLQNPSLRELVERFGDKGHQYYEISQKFNQDLAKLAVEYKDHYFTERLLRSEAFLSQCSLINLESLSNYEIVEHIFNILEHLRTESCVDFVVSARLGFYYTARLRKFIKDNLSSDPETINSIFSELNQGLEHSEITNANLLIANSPTEEDAIELAKKVVSHYSTDEMLEIRHPLFSEDEEALKDYVLKLRSSRYQDQILKQRTARKQATSQYKDLLPTHLHTEYEHLTSSAFIYMGLRETVKYHFSKEYALIRKALLTLQERLNLNTEDIFSIYPEELTSLVEDPEYFQSIISSRQIEFELHQQIDLPRVITEENIEQIDKITENTTDLQVITGRVLSSSPEIVGTVINLEELSPEEAKTKLEEFIEKNIPIILVAKQMNLSHDPLIAISKGLVLENGGIASHGAQRARELGKPALGGIKSRQLPTGTIIKLNTQNQLIEIVHD